MIKIKEKYIFNPFILAWAVFGFVIFSYMWIEKIRFPDNFDNWTIIEWYKHIVIYLILTLYVILYFKRKKERRPK